MFWRLASQNWTDVYISTPNSDVVILGSYGCTLYLFCYVKLFLYTWIFASSNNFGDNFLWSYNQVSLLTQILWRHFFLWCSQLIGWLLSRILRTSNLANILNMDWHIYNTNQFFRVISLMNNTVLIPIFEKRIKYWFGKEAQKWMRESELVQTAPSS